MSRIARVVIPDYPHHIVQRGNRRQQIFFRDEDRIFYLDLLKNHGKRAGITFWAYCLMENHVHLIAVPKTPESLTKGISAAHWRYTLAINTREDWKGHLWQGRLKSYPLDENYLLATVRYIELNPVKAGLVAKPEDYRWSSARAHVLNKPDRLIVESPLSIEIKDWGSFLATEIPESIVKLFDKHAATGRPLGDNRFIQKLEKITGRVLRVQRRGPKPRKRLLVSAEGNRQEEFR